MKKDFLYLTVNDNFTKVVNPKLLNLLLSRECEAFDNWIGDILNSPSQQIFIDRATYNKQDISLLSIQLSFFNRAKIIALHVPKTHNPTFVHDNQGYRVLLVQFPLEQRVFLGSDLNISDFNRFITTHLTKNKRSTLLLKSLYFRTEESIRGEKSTIYQRQLNQNVQASKTATLYFNYHNDEGSYDHFKKILNQTPGLQCCYLEIDLCNRKAFEVFNSTGNLELFREVLTLQNNFREQTWLNNILEVAKICYQNQIVIVPVDDITQNSFANVHQPESLKRRNHFIANVIQQHLEENNIKMYTGFFGAKHVEIAQLLNIRSCFLSPDLDHPKLKQLVLAPEFQSRFTNAQVKAELLQEYNKFNAIEVTQPKFTQTRYRSSTCLCILGLFAVTTATVVGTILYNTPSKSPSI